MDYKIKVWTRGNHVWGRVTHGSLVLWEDQEYVDSCAGLGGYDLAELGETKRQMKRLAEAFVAGHKTRSKENPTTKSNNFKI